VTGPVLPAELETAAQIWFERGGGHMAQAYATAQFAIAREGRFTVVARREGTAEETFHVFRAGRLGVGASLAVRTAALRAIGGFDVVLGAGTRCMGGEDQLLLVELLLSGRRITFDPAAFVWHTHRATVDELTTQMYSYGLGYTAMLAAAARHGHRAGLLAYLLQAVYLLPRKLLRRRTGQAASVPRELARVELRGLINGPWVYWRSMRVARAGQRRATRQASGPATPGQPGMPSDFAEHQDVRR
jgi:GT2 family glycosyltransferase